MGQCSQIRGHLERQVQMVSRHVHVLARRLLVHGHGKEQQTRIGCRDLGRTQVSNRVLYSKSIGRSIEIRHHNPRFLFFSAEKFPNSSANWAASVPFTKRLSSTVRKSFTTNSTSSCCLHSNCSTSGICFTWWPRSRSCWCPCWRMWKISWKRCHTSPTRFKTWTNIVISPSWRPSSIDISKIKSKPCKCLTKFCHGEFDGFRPKWSSKVLLTFSFFPHSVPSFLSFARSSVQQKEDQGRNAPVAAMLFRNRNDLSRNGKSDRGQKVAETCAWWLQRLFDRVDDSISSPVGSRFAQEKWLINYLLNN